MRITLKSRFASWAWMALEVAVFLALIVWTVRAALADWVAKKLTPAGLSLAVKIDPGDSQYHLLLGRTYQYNLTAINPDLALEQLRKAVGLNPFDPQLWLDLGAALEFQGKIAEAEACLRQADFLAPHLPPYQWIIGNFFLLHGNVDEAFRHFKVVLTGSSKYDTTLFDIAWKASGDANKILDQLIPEHLDTEISYLNYLLSHRRFDEAQDVWRRISGSSEKLNPRSVTSYIDSLIAVRRPLDAYHVWEELQRKGLVNTDAHSGSSNLLVHGDFEQDVINMGFDWRIAPVEGVYVGIDQTTYHSPGRSLLIRFSGNANLDYHQVFQYVMVTPGLSYRLSGFFKTEDITTDSGPRLKVEDFYDPRALMKISDGLVGTTTGWETLTLDFTASPTTNLIEVDIVRLPSRKLDNLIAGKVWLDDLTLTPIR